MVRVTCLSPTKSYFYCSSTFAHLELLIFNLQTTILLLGAIIEQHTKQTTSTTKNNTPKQKKGLKRMYRKIGLVATVTRAQETQKTELKQRF